jgi:hypothetical protein
MRKFILISVMVLASATAQAATTRGLALASSDGAAVTQPAQEQLAAPAHESAPAYVARPVAVETRTEQPKVEASKPEASKLAPEKVASAPASEVTKPEAGKTDAAKAEKPKRRHSSTEARVIYELHRHGIYW